jgi:hypothetical protein
MGQDGTLTRRRVSSPVHSLVVCLAPAVRSKVHTTARAAGSDASAWVCHLQHQVSLADLPATWQVGEADARSHDSRDGGTRDRVRVDGPTWQKLDELSAHVRTSMTEVIRQSVAQARPKDVPPAEQTDGGPPRSHPRRAGS